ncbi:MAG: septum formation initiator family protein [Crocinitomicaceae bacterium]
MKKYVLYFKNRYVISTLALALYILLLHDTDVFSLQKRKDKVANLEIEIVRRAKDIEDLKEDLKALEDLESLEKFAREKYYFKKSSEDLFVVSNK